MARKGDNAMVTMSASAGASQDNAALLKVRDTPGTARRSCSLVHFFSGQSVNTCSCRFALGILTLAWLSVAAKATD